MLKMLEDKMKEVAEKLEQSAGNHNYLIGAMNVLKELYVAMSPVPEEVEEAE